MGIFCLRLFVVVYELMLRGGNVLHMYIYWLSFSLMPI